MGLIMYFYIRVYRGMYKRVNTEMNYTEKIRKRRENAVAKNTLMLTVVLLVSVFDTNFPANLPSGQLCR